MFWELVGAAQCLGELYHHFGRRITSGLLETTMIVTKLMKFNEDFVRQEALHMLQNALEGSGGSAASSAYTEAYRIIMRLAVGDKSFSVRIAAARCLKAFANIGGPGLGVAELDNSASYCVKALEDPVSRVRDAFAEALGAVLALGMNPEAQVQPRGKGQFTPKKLEGGLQKHLVLPFMKASGPRLKDIRIGVTLSWVSFLQAIRLKYLHPDSELQNFALQVMEMLRVDTSADAQALACVLYILRVAVTDQMTEPTQRSFLVFLGKQLQSPDASPSMKVAALRTLSHALKTLGEVPFEFKDVLDNTVVAALSHSSPLVWVEAALTLRALAEVDPSCVGGLISYGVTTLSALRENFSFEKGSNLKVELDLLRGQASVLAALVSISPKLPLGYPARLPKSVLEVSKKMLTESSRNPMAATVEKEAGLLLLSSLLASLPKEELEDQVFDILSLWAALFTGNAESQIKQIEDLTPTICVWSAAIDALTAFIRCFVSPNAGNKGILLQPVLLYLSRALAYISLVASKEQRNLKPAMDTLIVRTLIAYLSLSDPMAYKGDHPQILQICTTTFSRDASGCEESSCLRMLLDKRDAWLGPWIPGRDWLEDELRAFQGGKDGDLPCVWEDELPTFPQAETISKMLVNQKLLCFGTMFASQDSGGMLSLLDMIEQCLKAGKKQSWHRASVTNICVGLLAGLKALLALRPQPLGSDILSSAQAIFLSILAEGDICASQRRAASEGLGLLARLGNDIFTARLTRSLLGDVTGAADSSYAGSIAFALGCIHRSAGGMALSSLVPATVNSISLLAKSPVAGLQVWSLHGLLLTIEAAGLSYVSQIQATLGLATDILLSEENGWVDLQQGVGRLINAIVAVLGPELAPGSIFFSRCKSVVAEISCRQETTTLIENVRFTQQLVLFAPQAVTVHSHVQTLLPTLSSRQPTLRHLAVSTLRHLIEKDPASIIDEQIEDTLFHMLDEETDTEIGNLVRTTIMRLLYASCPSCPSHWLSICRAMVLATSSGRDSRTSGHLENDPLNGPDGDTRLNFGDSENMVSSSNASSLQDYAFDSTSISTKREKHLRYRTRVFAAECLSHLPAAVGKDPAHFDISLARKMSAKGDWLALHVQELIALAYQISTIQFENMRPIGVGLLSTIMDKFGIIPDPDLPGHLLLEQYQAQLVSAVRTALDTYAGPILLETGLQLATKILTNGIISGDQVAVKRIFSLISRPLNNFEDLYYPSCAEWVSCKIKIRLLTAHASLKCYTYAFLRKKHVGVPDEYLAQLPLFSESSTVLGKYWISILKDFSYVCFRLHLKQNWKPFLDGIQSPLVSAKLQPCLEEAWPVIFQAVALDAAPFHFDMNLSSQTTESTSKDTFISGYSMVQLKPEEFRFLWGFALLVLFQGQDPALHKHLIPLGSAKAKLGGNSPVEDTDPLTLKLYEIVLPVFQFLSSERFFSMGFLTMDICRDLLQVFSYSICSEYTWDSLAISVLSQIVRNCPKDFLETESFASLIMELCLAYLFKVFQRNGTICSDNSNWEDMVYVSLTTAKTLIGRLGPERQLKSLLVLLLIGYKCIRGASTDICFSKANEFVQCMNPLLNTIVDDKSTLGDESICYLRTIIGACLDAIASLTKNCIESIHLVENKTSSSCKLLQMKLAFALEQMSSLAKLAYEIVCLGENQENDPILFTVIQHCTKCIQIVLTDTNIQVLSIGLQVLKSMVQRGTNSESNSFLLFFNGELLREIFTLIDRMLRKPISREAVAIASESLRVLVILQTLSRASECQKGLMNLLLEAVVMVFSASDDGLSQELNDLRSMVGKLVSQLAQIPSSAVHLKDVLLTMPVASRQQLQGIIRAAVTQEHRATQTKPAMPSLVIKLPAQTEETRQKGPTPTISTPPEQFDNSSEEEEEDDDWDAFQSFPASTSEVTSSLKVESATEEPALVEKCSISDFTAGNSDIPEHAGSMSRDYVKEVADSDQTSVDTEQCHRHHQMDELVPSPDDQSSSDLQSVDVTEGFSEQCDDHLDEICHTSTDHENLDTSESVKVAEACTEPCNDLHEEEFQAVLSRENDEAPDLQPVDCAEEYTEPFGNKHRDRNGRVASDNDIDIAPTGLQSIETAKRLAKLNTLDDDTESKRSPGKINDLLGSLGSSDPEGFSKPKLPTDTYDGTPGESNWEADEDARNKKTSKSKSTNVHHEGSEGSGLPEG
ncbi:HEAT repeat-containing protein isoform 1 [Actinidia chinensis var. chinensis]|uniref:HEAT repeat-containing protein isoform 1 n=1 Tax=Actinidia chinensis var. chinensis TaxID=1590841 RepID=A0A2R6PA04_ACTCC|nr:HEAT repeat-containing protein isoform 1 [Actinidia chinensis var. chinensis]